MQDYGRQKEQLENEIFQQRSGWAEEERERERQQKEAEENLKKQRQREMEEYEYKKSTSPPIRLLPTNFPFDPNGGHGYVWHCHIVDHEDNEMMRPDEVMPNTGATRTYIKGTDY